MTGEITLSGLVMPIGGVKGKVLAARRAGIKRVILPKRNEPELKEVPEESRGDLEIILVENIDELLDQALTPAPGKSDSENRAAESESVPATNKTSYDGPEARV
jgi:ATP-dependent Lon protease